MVNAMNSWEGELLVRQGGLCQCVPGPGESSSSGSAAAPLCTYISQRGPSVGFWVLRRSNTEQLLIPCGGSNFESDGFAGLMGRCS